ncbi:hypothetical protein [Porphyrobacter sp. AAP82]|uniref:hypothetical protein n=1 Tax=Porphyrobacter sp. AAP82 TaxID=1248917 RepID=UPI0012DFA80D|nr:hypothetical protein [Porphyrobacter sp. AAP82]
MKVCSACNEIVASDQGCARSDCLNQSKAITDPAPKIDPGLTGKADRFVQAGLDGAGNAARAGTRRAAFVVAVIFAVVLVATIFKLNASSGSESSEAGNASAAQEASSASNVGSLPNTIPNKYWGRWTEDPSRCATRYDDTKVEIYSDAIKFWESEGEVIKTELKEGGTLVELSMFGEGEGWTLNLKIQQTTSPSKILLNGSPRYKCS